VITITSLASLPAALGIGEHSTRSISVAAQNRGRHQDGYYPFESSDEERLRLMTQAELLAPMSKQLFEKACIVPGMRVLDIGSGSGNVSFLAARLVGREGSVIGVDSDPGQVEFAKQRAKAEGWGNVSFMVGDYREVVLASPVDAIVGRLVLMYAPEPVVALKCTLRNLRAGGVIALQESVTDYDAPVLIQPPDCLAGKVVEWFRAGFKHAGVQPRLGLRLFGLLKAAGLDCSTEIDMSVPLQQGPEGALFRTLTSVVRSQVSAIVASGAATEREIDIETLEQRLIADAPPGGVVGYFNSGLVGIWARKP
jgi:SAM-dependent methyltransferase